MTTPGGSPLPHQPNIRHDLPAGRDWWRGAVGYEIYIRSFLDTNADGVGDLDGITARLDHLERLGIDVLWITPFFPSPGKDQGYDVADYVDVDPQFGTLADFDRLVCKAKARGLRVFVDLVPNHSSDQHPWFRAAIAEVHSPYRDYYLFRPPAPGGGPPNNWVSHFGGPAWTLDPAGTGEYYCHLFLPEQPDLNWANPAVREEFRTILRFWCDRGVDGFRVDVAHGLTKDPEFLDNPQIREVTADMHPSDVFASFEHVHDLHRRETAEIFREWRQVLEPYGAVLLGEIDIHDIERFTEYLTGSGLDTGFVLKVAAMPWEPAAIISLLLRFEQAANGGAAWALSSHDQPRAVSRFGGGETGVRRAMAMTTLLLALDGITFLYQGEELGVPDAIVVGEARDPVSTRNPGAAGRDVARGPMPWDATKHNGFSTAPSVWLETTALPAEATAAAQVGTAGSVFERFREMVALRRRLPALWREPMEIIVREDTTLVMQRGDLTIIANLGVEPFEFVGAAEQAASGWRIEFESRPGAASSDGTLRVAPESTVVLGRRS